jgi:hypothetical protein
MIGDVAKQRLHGRGDRHHLGVLEPTAHLDQRHHRIANAQQVAADHVEPLHVHLLGGFGEDAVLDRLHFGVQRFQHWHVVVDDEIEDGA